MGLPLIQYTPSAGPGGSIDFTEELSSWSGPFRNPARAHVRSQGGVYMAHFEHFEEEMELVWDHLAWNETLANAFIGFWSHAARGGVFSFARDRDFAGYSTLRADHAYGATNLLVQTGPPSGSLTFTVGERIIVESVVDGWQQEAAVINTKDVTSSPSLQLDRGLIFNYRSGDIVRSEYYWPSLVISDQRWPLREDASGMQAAIELRVRTYAARVVAAEP